MVTVVVPMYAGIATIVSFFKALFPGVLPDALRRSATPSSHGSRSSEIGSIPKSVALVRFKNSSCVKFYQNRSVLEIA
jgi:hypothetical protein